MRVGWGGMHYISLGKWTDKGIQTLRDAPKRVENVKKMAQKLGGSVQVYFTMGEYDVISIAEMPSDEAYNKLILWVESQGNVRTKSTKAWTPEEAAKMIADIPQ